MKIFRRTFTFGSLFIAVMLLRVIVIESAGTGAVPKKGRSPADVSEKIRFTLDQVLEKNLSGLGAADLDEVAKLQENAAVYIRYRKGQMSKLEKQEFKDNCEQSRDFNPDCKYVGEDWKKKMAKFLQMDPELAIDENGNEDFESEEKAHEDVDIAGAAVTTDEKTVTARLKFSEI